jgi:ferrous iron transport protein B
MTRPCHGSVTPPVASLDARVLLVGSPNAGKTSIFNRLTGLNAKTGNYPGVTVGRSTGSLTVASQRFAVEDLPGAYGLTPISPDEQVVIDALSGDLAGIGRADALVLVVDATTLRRSLHLVAQVLALHLPTVIALTLTDELTGRGGTLDPVALERALGVPVIRVVAHRGLGISNLRDALPTWRSWQRPVLDAPFGGAEQGAWVESVLLATGYRPAAPDRRTARIDAVLLHPVWGSLVFAAVMVAFFQVIFAFAAPLQELVEVVFSGLADLVERFVALPWLAGLLGDAVLGGVGGVVIFLPQILLMFLLLSLLEGIGYMSRAAFLMDRVMGAAGLEGRAFVALLSSFACAVPGIMATRTLPSAKDRIATMMAAPLMTCSARLPVYILLIGLLVDPEERVGPLQVQGLVMFALYLLGAVSAMAAAWVVKAVQDRDGLLMPFYMEMPPYRLPTPRSIALSMWGSAAAFLRKCGTIILITTILLWLLLNLPLQSDAELRAAGINPADDGAVSAYVLDTSAAAAIGRAVEPAFDPLGFDWRVNVGVLASLSARETFVATLGQIASAVDPDNPADALAAMTYTGGGHEGEPVFSAPSVAALMVFFVYALQCMSTVGVMRRETGTWKWPLIAFGYMFALAWLGAWVAHGVVLMAVEAGAAS